jgi:hypothetical protein
MNVPGSYQKIVSSCLSCRIDRAHPNNKNITSGQVNMTTKQFHLRLKASYQGSENTLDDLTVEIFNQDEGDAGAWEALDLNIRSAGFLLFINGLFSCQHLYMRSNSAECNLQLASASGELFVETSEDWEITQAQVSFVATLKSGEVSDEDLDYIIDRMHHCPVSSNLPKHVLLQVSVTYQ